ncbi:metalloprotease [Robertkochia aurantiaca]|uniref:metalloprotease n=1 Tax=Robertkochia aurantiaca TaxID=2873700 RepID=UPI001CC9B845|nr:metalloprotease [Robertkochia sp. 3YJGBD-33]
MPERPNNGGRFVYVNNSFLKRLIAGLVLMILHTGFSQSSHSIEAHLLPNSRSLQIQQEILFHNTSKDTLNSIYLYDWNHSYSNKNTALAARFGEEFNKSLHLAKKEDRGSTRINTITDRNYNFLDWERTEADIIRIQLKFPVYPDQQFLLRLSYINDLPNASFTGYGFTSEGNYNLRYWYLIPGIYDEGEWKIYSNKDLDDLAPHTKSLEIRFVYPEKYTLITDLEIVTRNTENLNTRTVLYGEDRSDARLFLRQESNFEAFRNEQLTLITDLAAKDMSDVGKAVAADQIVRFITENLGAYPHEKLLVTQIDYDKNPLYGLNQLPSFIRPFPESFQYELKLLKTTLNNFLENSLFLDYRKNNWVADGIQTFLMMKYVETFYPDMKLLGNLSDNLLVRGFNFAKLDFNDQYPLLYTLMARRNLDQPLGQPRDSLIKFNEKIANKYKVGVGLSYLDSYLGEDVVDTSIKTFYENFKGNRSYPKDFEAILRQNSNKPLDWFFDTYIATRKKIDFNIKKLQKTDDSLFVTLKNKRKTNAPITLFGIDNRDSVVFKQWYDDIIDEKTVAIPRDSIDRLALNYDRVIPEFNERDNWRTTQGFFSTNKSFQFRFFKDLEDPFYYQVLYVPVFRYNIYDGFTPGLRLYNKTFLERPFIYDLEPSYAIREQSLVGSGSLRYRKYLEEGSMYVVTASLQGSSFHYAPNARYSTITPALTMGFRGKDLRSNEREFLNLRFVNVLRQESPIIDTDPDYSVFNARYVYSNNGIIDYKSWFADLQVSNEFAKISFNWEFRKLYENNRQFNLRLFAGKFIYNQTNSDFFSFALDRPTDYLFDYNYLGRSEDTGLSSQQIIIAEGGFKSRLTNPFASDLMVTANASVNLWRWVEVYGDVGWIKDLDQEGRFVYDSGIRANLVTDYFELYFPVYSNNGWELSAENYSSRIRFIITLSPKTLIGLFTRKWF